jgi:serine/threonine protein kinase
MRIQSAYADDVGSTSPSEIPTKSGATRTPLGSSEFEHRVGTSPRGCLSEDEIIAFTQGELSDESLGTVDDHLDMCSACQEVVSGFVSDWMPSTSMALSLGVGPGYFGPGHELAGRYVVEYFLARGGMGEVYVAYDQVLGQRVALKTLILSERAGYSVFSELAKEVEFGRRVRHPNVCRVHELCFHDEAGASPTPFLTMELIEGERLSQHMLRGKLPGPEVARIARQLLSGLNAMHEVGVLHLDIKTDNIMVRSHSPNAESVIIDFGLARRAQNGRSRRSRHIGGTVAYMAPDQVLGLCPSTQVDVFSFGVVLFEMLTGRPPFLAGGIIPWKKCVARRVAEPPPPPSRLDASVSPGMDEFVLCCLAGQRQIRYPDAGAALDAFDRLVPAIEIVSGPT